MESIEIRQKTKFRKKLLQFEGKVALFETEVFVGSQSISGPVFGSEEPKTGSFHGF